MHHCSRVHSTLDSLPAVHAPGGSDLFLVIGGCFILTRSGDHSPPTKLAREFGHPKGKRVGVIICWSKIALISSSYHTVGSASLHTNRLPQELASTSFQTFIGSAPSSNLSKWILVKRSLQVPSPTLSLLISNGVVPI
jgi:hypothetical protein